MAGQKASQQMLGAKKGNRGWWDPRRVVDFAGLHTRTLSILPLLSEETKIRGFALRARDWMARRETKIVGSTHCQLLWTLMQESWSATICLASSITRTRWDMYCFKFFWFKLCIFFAFSDWDDCQKVCVKAIWVKWLKCSPRGKLFFVYA